MPATVTAKGVKSGSGTQLLSVTTVTGDLLIVVVALGTTRTLTITWNGITMSQDVTANNASGQKLIICSLVIATGATANVSAAASANTFAYIASTVSGVAQVTPLDKSSTGTGNSTAPNSGATATTAQADEICWGAHSQNSSAPNGTWDSGYTPNQSTYLSPVGVADAYLIVSSTGAQTASKTGTTSNQWAAAIATYKLAVAAFVAEKHAPILQAVKRAAFY